MNLRLVVPTAAMEKQALDFRQAFFDCGELVINGSEQLDTMDDYGAWLNKITRNARAETVDPSWVVTDTYFVVNDDDEIVGIIDLRHELKGFLVDFGHSGYSVRPSARRKGVATEMLRLLKERARAIGMQDLQLSAERSNIPSIKTIERNGGVWQRSFDFQGEAAEVYLIQL